MKIIKGIFNILSWAVYACIIVYLLIASPMIAGYRPVVVLSGSMEPTYHVGSVIYYKSADFADIKVGDAITFRTGENAMVTHRVAEKSELSGTFTTKGDANMTEDPNPVEYSQVMGKVLKFSIPMAGFFVGYSKNFMVIGMMAAVIVINILLDSLFPTKKKGEERTEHSDEEKET
ncbi:signal peptidase I [Clostridium transplantifaecale]|uniref:signal peptidase I n=1 Tax=Clostridium transplantifaecale TaxID=2479838 RepID=UPI000F63B83F|nr:signal peptidase I [Clostridium transplantifaecale]